jgi:hypothetical protein
VRTAGSGGSLPGMPLLGFRRLGVALLAALALTVVVAPANAMTEEECAQLAGVEDTCFSDGDGYALLEGADPFATEPGIPGGFAALFVLVVLVGIGVTIWKVTTARQMAREAGIDPDRATGMTLLDEGGFSATYLASSLKNPPTASPAAPRPAAERLTELKGLLESGAITQAEHDARRQEIIGSV